jgi:hypothetical protein
LEVNEEDVEELVEEHSKDLTTEDLEELKKQLNQERDKEDKECSSEEEDSNKKGRMLTGDIKNAALLGRVSVFGYKVASQQS